MRIEEITTAKLGLMERAIKHLGGYIVIEQRRKYVFHEAFDNDNTFLWRAERIRHSREGKFTVRYAFILQGEIE